MDSSDDETGGEEDVLGCSVGSEGLSASQEGLRGSPGFEAAKDVRDATPKPSTKSPKLKPKQECIICHEVSVVRDGSRA